MDFWTVDALNGTRVLQLVDTNTASFGEWYTDNIGVDGGAAYLLRYSLPYVQAGEMRVSVNFYDGGGALINILSFTFSGTQTYWVEYTQPFVTPGNAAQLHSSSMGMASC